MLLAVYFFLAGMAVATSGGHLLWLMPLAAVTCGLLLSLILTSKALFPGFRCAVASAAQQKTQCPKRMSTVIPRDHVEMSHAATQVCMGL